MSKDFYNRVARQFGSYSVDVEALKEFPTGNPEADFKEKLLTLADPTRRVLDVGCADGRFTLSIAPYFGTVLAIDYSGGMLKSAKALQRRVGISSVKFQEVDLYHNALPAGAFDVIYCRRGPTDYKEFNRLLQPGGTYLEIEIGEQDTRGIKEMFGRGQNYGQWNTSVSETVSQEVKDAGLKLVSARDYEYTEYYKTRADLDMFLQGVPIFEDYNSKKDSASLDKYVALNMSERGIALPRHRVVILATKA